MKPDQLIAQCREQIRLVGDSAKVMLSMPGKCNASMSKRLCRGGPLGRINGDDMTAADRRVIVFFSAAEVLAYLEASLT